MKVDNDKGLSPPVLAFQLRKQAFIPVKLNNLGKITPLKQNRWLDSSQL
jgi:hypothetical protein